MTGRRSSWRLPWATSLALGALPVGCFDDQALHVDSGVDAVVVQPLADAASPRSEAGTPPEVTDGGILGDAGGGTDDAVFDVAAEDATAEGPDAAVDAAGNDAFDAAGDAAGDTAGTPDACAAGSDCAGPPPDAGCDPAADTCPADQHCERATGGCVAGCRGDPGCATGHCDSTAHACVPCVTDAHCAAGMLCMGNACVAGCSAAHPCAAGLLCCDGGCVDTQTSTAACGGCGAVCGPAHATGACLAGRCAVASCAAGWGDCDRDPSNGCEHPLSADTAHCGACGHACNADQVCTAGACACPAGRTDCAGSCRLTASDPTACGACGRACSAYQVCPAGTCVAAYARVMLTWSRPGDLDLHVRTPFGQEIYFGNPTVGAGRLDRNDTVGTGPEDIYWTSSPGFPRGSYNVCVVASHITGPTSFTVTVEQRLLRMTTFTGMRAVSTGDERCTTTSPSYVGSFLLN